MVGKYKIIVVGGFIALSSFAIAQAPPQLDELSDTKVKLIAKSMEAAQLQLNIATTNVQKAREDMQQLVIALEAKYPGFTLNMQNGTLIAKPQAAETKDPHTGNTITPGK